MNSVPPAPEQKAAHASKQPARTDDDAPASVGRAFEVFVLAALFALGSALVYVGANAAKFFVLSRLVPVSRQVIWMAPVAHLAIWFVAAVPVALLAPRLTRESAIRGAVFVFAFLATFSVLLPWTQIGRMASAVLAAGVGAFAARVMAARAAPFLRLAGIATATLLGTLVVAAGATFLWQWRSVTKAYAALPPVGAATGSPNVLLLILDTVRASSLSLYGNPVATTPQLDSIARSAIVFDHAYSAAPWTLPSHSSMFTGEYAGGLTADFMTPLDGSRRTLAEALSSCGYEAAGFVGNLHYAAWDSGLSRGFARYRDYHVSWRQVIKSSWLGQMRLTAELMRANSLRKIGGAIRNLGLVVVPKPEGDEIPATELTDVVLGWQAQRSARPFFAFVNYFDAHTPYHPPAAFSPPRSRAVTMYDLYQSEIRFVDHEVGRLLRELERRGALANTLVIVTADHGELFGEHGLKGHDNSVYREVLHVPLVARLPGGAFGGQRVASAVSLRDIAATVSSAVGLPCAAGFPGASLSRYWTDSADTSSPAMAELHKESEMNPADVLQRSRTFALVDSSHYYVFKRETRTEELYAIDDVADAQNLARADGGRMAREYQSRLRAIVVADTGSGRSKAAPRSPK